MASAVINGKSALASDLVVRRSVICLLYKDTCFVMREPSLDSNALIIN
jgi:hypothetical protein